MGERRRARALLTIAAIGAAALLMFATIDFPTFLTMLWVAFGAVSLLYTLRKTAQARKDLAERMRSGRNGPRLHSARWWLRSAKKSVAIALCIGGSASLALADRLIDGPAIFGGAILSLLTLIPAIFTWKQIDDDRSHQRLQEMMDTPAGVTPRRSVDG